MVGDVGRGGDLRLVAGDQHAVLRDHQVRLDVVGPLARGQLVRRQRMLGPVARRATVADHQLIGLLWLRMVGGGGARHRRQHGEREREWEED
jgi:hypothetical protein